MTLIDSTTKQKLLGGLQSYKARFRYLIVHLYWKDDNRRVYEIVQNELDGLDTFRQQLSE